MKSKSSVFLTLDKSRTVYKHIKPCYSNDLRKVLVGMNCRGVRAVVPASKMKSCRLGVSRYYKSRVSNQNGVSLLYIMLEIHHSVREPSK